MYKNYLKHLFDFTAALVGLLLLSPIFVLVTIGLFFALSVYQSVDYKSLNLKALHETLILDT